MFSISGISWKSEESAGVKARGADDNKKLHVRVDGIESGALMFVYDSALDCLELRRSREFYWQKILVSACTI